ncbi:hypothetical protein BsWGS_18508 [Bradybaena similaris]
MSKTVSESYRIQNVSSCLNMWSFKSYGIRVYPHRRSKQCLARRCVSELNNDVEQQHGLRTTEGEIMQSVEAIVVYDAVHNKSQCHCNMERPGKAHELEANLCSNTAGCVDRLESTSVQGSSDGASRLLVIRDNISAVRKCCRNQNGNEVGKPNYFAVNSRIIRIECEYEVYILLFVYLDRMERRVLNKYILLFVYLGRKEKRVLNKKDVSSDDLFKSKRNIKEIENEDPILDAVSLYCNSFKAETRQDNLISSGYIYEDIQLLKKNSKNSIPRTFSYVYVNIKLIQYLKKRYRMVNETGAIFKSLIENENKLTKDMEITFHSYKSETSDKKSAPAMYCTLRFSTRLRQLNLQKVNNVCDSLQVFSPITYCNVQKVSMLQQLNYCLYFLIIMTRRERTDVARSSRTDVAEITRTDIAGIKRIDVAGITRTDVAAIKGTDARISNMNFAGIIRTDVPEMTRTDIARIKRTDGPGIFLADKPKTDNKVKMYENIIDDTQFGSTFLKYKRVSVLVKNEKGRNAEGKRNSLDDLYNITLKTYSFTPSRALRNICVNMLPHSVCGIPWNKFERETMRLASFAKYPTTAVKSPANLASSGFVYVGNGLSDRVKCYFCSVEKESWESNDDIDNVHKSLSPSCPMVIVQFSNNVASTGAESPRQTAAVNTGAVPLCISMGTAHSVYDEVDNLRPHHISQPATEASTHQRSTSQRERAVTPSVLANTNGRINTPGSSNTSLLPVLGMLEQNNSSAVRNNRINPRSQHSHDSNSINEVDSIRNLQNHSTTNQDSVSHHPNINAQVYAIPPVSNGTAAPEEHNPAQRNPQLTYQLLGIFHERPKYPDNAILARRLLSFDGWPEDHPISKEDLAKSGLFFAGYGDCCKCFFCGGGLRNWEVGDDAYVEHARWFDKCGYIRQFMGMEFVEAVRAVKSRGGTITFKDVTDYMTSRGQSIQNLFNDKKISDDVAVRSLIDDGYDAEAVSRAATSLRESGELLSADVILRKLRDQQSVINGGAVAGATTSDGAVAGATASDTADLVDFPGEGKLQALKEQNYALRSHLTCKICMDKEVRIVFLPCGHLISCQECAIALQDCPLCRSHIRARARAYIN